MRKVAVAASLPTASSPELGNGSTVASSADKPFPPDCPVCGERLAAAPAGSQRKFVCPNDPVWHFVAEFWGRKL
jgi:hypothetical protein